MIGRLGCTASPLSSPIHKTTETYSATYLPEVATEQGWNREQAIAELIAKSGYKKAVTAALRARIRLTRYQSVKGSMTYAQYSQLRRLRAIPAALACPN